MPKKAKLHVCDISDKVKVSKIIQQQKFDLVMHFAGLIRVEESIKKPKKYINYNYQKSKIFNCGYGKGVSVKEVLKTLNKILGFSISASIGKRRPGDSKKVVANTNKLSKYFSWKPKCNNLRLIINNSLKWEKKLKYFYSD